MMNSVKLSKSEIERIKVVVPTIAELRIIDLMRDYRAIRNRRFGSSIPAVELVMIRFLPQKEIARFCGKADGDTIGACLAGSYRGDAFPYVLAIADDLNSCETRITLVHEMAHMKVNIKFGRQMGHGEHWKKEMRRLAQCGTFDDWW